MTDTFAVPSTGEIIELPPAHFIGIDLASGPDVTVMRLSCPLDTAGWTVTRQDGIETYLSPDQTAYVRARENEDADVIVTFTRITPLPDLRLVRADQSLTVRRAEKKARRERRELRARGYDAPEPNKEA